MSPTFPFSGGFASVEPSRAIGLRKSARRCVVSVTAGPWTQEPLSPMPRWDILRQRADDALRA